MFRVMTRTLADVDWSRYDFLDLGAGTGGSMESASARIGGVGVGVEGDAERAAEARAKGFDVVHGNLFDVPEQASVRYVVLNNVLEHLPTMELVERAICHAAKVAREFVYIRHPSFEGEAYLRSLGFKQFWQDWTGHPSHILLTDFMTMFRRIGVSSFVMHPAGLVPDSTDSSILPVSAPIDQFHYDVDRHGPKRHVEFDAPIHHAFDIVAVVSPQVSRVSLDYYRDPNQPGHLPNITVKSDVYEELERLRSRRVVRFAAATWAWGNARTLAERRRAAQRLLASLRRGPA